MNIKKFKIVILTHGGSERLLEAVLALDEVEISGLIVEKATRPRRPFSEKVRRSIRYDGYAATFKKLAAKIVGSNSFGYKETEMIRKGQDLLKKRAAELGISFMEVSNYHDESTLKLLKSLDADLGILWGTNIISESVFAIPRLGSINLHQGLAPLYRGGPTVFWELFHGEKEIGITIHFVSAQVDTGDIVLQKTVALDYDFLRYGLEYEKFLSDFRDSLIEPSAKMMAEAVRLIVNKEEQRIRQNIAIGKRYRLPTKRQKAELSRILRKRELQARRTSRSEDI